MWYLYVEGERGGYGKNPRRIYQDSVGLEMQPKVTETGKNEGIPT